MQQITDEKLKNAICNNDLEFLKQNVNNFFIDYCFKDEDNDTLLSYAISDPDSDVYTFFLLFSFLSWAFRLASFPFAFSNFFALSFA